MHNFVRFTLGCMMASMVSCGTSGGDETDATMLTVATFNTGLSRAYVDHAALRLVALEEAIGQLDDVDVLCLQEVWTSEDRARLIKAATQFPHSLFEETSNDSLFADIEDPAPKCTETETSPLAMCAKAHFAKTDDLTSCVLEHCDDHFYALSEVCQGCAASNIGLADIDLILNACLSDAVTSFTYDGSNGLLLLSRHPINDPTFRLYDSFLTARGALFGRIKNAIVGCTHLTSDLGNVPSYTGKYRSYGHENVTQLDSVFRDMAMDDVDAPQILMGDLNTGPGHGGLTAELPENWSAIEQAGWAAANVSSDTPQCTWCAANLITKSSTDQAIDHILVRRGSIASARRFLDEAITITTESGDVITTSYSDHFGLAATITIE